MELTVSADAAECFDDSEDFDGAYVYSVTGPSEEKLLAVASAIANRSGVPAGAFAVVSHDEAASSGMGHRVELPSHQPPSSWVWHELFLDDVVSLPRELGDAEVDTAVRAHRPAAR